MQMQASIWICTYQMQTIKFMSLLPLLVCSSCPRILCAPQYWSMSMIALSSHLPLCHPRIIHIFVHFSPLLSSMTIKRAETTWNLLREDQWLPLEVVPLVLVGWPWIPLIGNHMKRLWFDTKSWIWVDGWVLNLHFWWTLSIWLKLTLLVTTCENMKIWNATCRILVGFLTWIPCSGAPPLMSKCLSIYLNLELFLMRVALLIWIDHLKLRITCGTTIVALDPLEWIYHLYDHVYQV